MNTISFIDTLALGDITKYDAIMEINYITSLNTLSFWHYRDKYINDVRKEELKKH